MDMLAQGTLHNSLRLKEEFRGAKSKVLAMQKVSNGAEIASDDEAVMRINSMNWINLENVYLTPDLTLAAQYRNINVSCRVQGLYN